MSFEKVPNFLGKFFEVAMKVDGDRFYRFNSYVLDAAERELCRGDETIPLTPKAFDTLVYLVKNAGHLTTKDELMAAVWPDSFVDEGNIPRTIHTLRKALGDDGDANKFIQTVPTKGYRFVADVEKVAVKIDDPSTEASAGDVRVETVTAGPDSDQLAESTEPRNRRHILFLAAAVLPVALLTGFWMSNGTMLPHSSVAGFVRHSLNGEAYRHFQQGKILVEERTPESYKQALEHFEKAIEIDPYYAEAYAGKADAKSYGLSGITHDDIASARAAVEQALALEENDPYALTIKCRISSAYDWEFDRAVTECQRAVDLGPNESGAHRELGFALNVVGRTEEALAEMNTAVALSPSSFNKRARAEVLYMSRHYDEAIEQLEQIVATDPNYTDAEKWLMFCFAMKSDHAAAFEHLVKLQEINGIEPNDLDAIRAAFMSGGWPAALRLMLDSSSGISKRRSILTAALYAQIGEKDKAFEILNDMHKRRAIMMVTVPREPTLDPLRDDPRFDAILTQLKLN